MVGKLIKYDLKDTSKAYLPVIGMILIGTVLALTSLSFAQGQSQLAFIFSTIMNFVIFGLVVGVVVMSVRATIYVLYGSIYTKNAYRLFTLPVKTWQIIVSKIMTSIIWSIVISILTFLSIGIIVGYVSEDFFIIFKGFGELMTQLSTMITPSLAMVFIIDSVLTSILGSMIILFAGSLSNSSLIRKNRGILTFVIVLITLSIYGQVASSFGADTMSVFARYNLNAFLVGNLNIQFMEFFWVFAFMGILIAGFTFATLWLWENKLEILN